MRAGGTVASGAASVFRPGRRSWMTKSGQHVAEALASRREQGGEQGRDAGEDPELQHTHQRPDERLAETFGAAVVAHHPQPHREFTQGLSPGQGLEYGRISDDHEYEPRQGHGRTRRQVEAAAGARGDDHQDEDEQRSELDYQVDGERDHAAREPCDRYLEDHGLTNDDLVHAGPRFGRFGHQVSRARGSSLPPWTLTRSWPRTSPTGSGSTRWSSGAGADRHRSR